STPPRKPRRPNIPSFPTNSRRPIPRNWSRRSSASCAVTEARRNRSELAQRGTSRDVPRIPGRRNRRGVTEIEVDDIVDGHARGYGRGHDVDAFADAVGTDDLGPDDPAPALLHQEPGEHGGGTREIPGAAGRLDLADHEFDPRVGSLARPQPGAADLDLADPGDRGAENPREGAVGATDVETRDPAGLV